MSLCDVYREEERAILEDESNDPPPDFQWSTNKPQVGSELPAHERLFKVSEKYAKRQNAVRWEIMRRRIQAENEICEMAERKSRFRRDGNGLTKEELDEVIDRHYRQAEAQKRNREEAAKAKADQEA